MNVTLSSDVMPGVGQLKGFRGHHPAAGDLDFDYEYQFNDLSGVQTSWSDDPIFLPTTITYTLTFFCGLFGNGLALVALLADVKSSRSATCLFLANLAIADILFLLLSVPNEMIAKFVSHWTSGKPSCKLAAFVEAVAGQSTVLNLAAVSIERLAD